MIGSNPTLTEARQDCDLSADGNLTQRALRNRISKNSGNMNLLALANTVVGQQLSIRDSWNSNNYTRNRTNRAWGANTLMTSGTVDVQGNQISLRGRNSGALDQYIEARMPGRITASGQYRLTGSFTVSSRSAQGYGSNLIYGQVAVIGNQSGYMAGASTNHLTKQYGTNNAGGYTYAVNEVVSLSNLRTFVTVIFYYVVKGSVPSGTADQDFRFENVKLVKI